MHNTESCLLTLISFLFLQSCVLAVLLRPVPKSELTTPAHAEEGRDSKFRENMESLTPMTDKHYAGNAADETQISAQVNQMKKGSTEKPKAAYDSGIITPRRQPLFKYVLHWRAAVLLATIFVYGFGISVVFVMLPDFALMNGITHQQVSQLYMVTGVFGLFYRLALVALGKLI